MDEKDLDLDMDEDAEEEQECGPSKEGYLHKRNEFFQWQRRWFTLSNGILRYYKQMGTRRIVCCGPSPACFVDGVLVSE